MNKGSNTVLIWILIWASLLVAMLYSPIGSPDLYYKKNYYLADQGVNFNRIKIKNEPSNILESEYYSTDFETNSNYRSTNYTQNNSYLADNTSNKYSLSSVGTINNNSNGVNSPSQFTSGSISLESVKFRNSSRNQKEENINRSSEVSFMSDISNSINTSTSNNLIASSLDLSIFSDINSTETNGYAQKVGIISPGEDDPNGDPIPVGDGWILMLVFGGIYSLKKSIMKIKIGVNSKFSAKRVYLRKLKYYGLKIHRFNMRMKFAKLSEII